MSGCWYPCNCNDGCLACRGATPPSLLVTFSGYVKCAAMLRDLNHTFRCPLVNCVVSGTVSTATFHASFGTGCPAGSDTDITVTVKWDTSTNTRTITIVETSNGFQCESSDLTYVLTEAGTARPTTARALARSRSPIQSTRERATRRRRPARFKRGHDELPIRARRSAHHLPQLPGDVPDGLRFLQRVPGRRPRQIPRLSDPASHAGPLQAGGRLRLRRSPAATGSSLSGPHVRLCRRN